MSAHYVYRVYGHDGRLIYVGCTINLFGRLKAHELNSWWAYQTSRVVAKVEPDKWSGLIEERRIIREERPRWNIFHRGPRETWQEADYSDYVMAMLNLHEPMTPTRLRRVHNVARHYRNRFGRDLPVAIPEINEAVA